MARTKTVLIQTNGTNVASVGTLNFTGGVTVTKGPGGRVDVDISGGTGTTSPLTTKGDLYGFNTTNARIPVGADGYVLTADSTQALGLKWAPGGGSSIATSLTEERFTATNGQTVFNLSSSPTFVQVYVGGVYQPNDQYTLSGSTVTLVNPVVVTPGSPVIVAIEKFNALAMSNAFTLTTSGTNGVATYTSGVLNIPNYTYTLPTASTTLLGGVKVDGTTITIAGGVISATPGTSSPLTTKGDIWGYTTTNVRVPVGADGYVLTADSTQAAGIKWAAPTGGTASPLTTKGDIWGYTTTNVRVPVGADGYVLTADSTQASGIKWAAPAAGGSPLSAKGDLYGFSTTNARIPVGTDGYILTADSTQALGIKWSAASGGGGGDYVSTLTNTEVSITGTTTLTNASMGKQHVITGSTNYTVTLPNPTGANVGKIISFRIDPSYTGLVTLDAAGFDFDGAGSRIMWAKESCTLYCRNYGWTKIFGRSLPFTCLTNSSYSLGSVPVNNFTQVTNLTTTSDPASLFNNSTQVITVPRPGSYQFTSKIRFSDTGGSAVPVSVGQGIHTSLIDGTWFIWHNTGANAQYGSNRDGSFNQRVVAAAAGDQYMLYYFYNGPSSGLTYAAMEMLEIPTW